MCKIGDHRGEEHFHCSYFIIEYFFLKQSDAYGIEYHFNNT